MHFIDDENLVSIPSRRDSDGVYDDLACVLDLCVGRRVDFLNINRSRSSDVQARGTFVARLGCDPFQTVQRFCEDARSSSLADTSGACEQIRVMNSVIIERVDQRASDGLLADHLIEALRPELSRKNV